MTRDNKVNIKLEVGSLSSFQIIIAAFLNLFINFKTIILTKVTPFKMASKKEKQYYMNKTDKEWQKELSEEEYNIMRKKGTETPFSDK